MCVRVGMCAGVWGCGCECGCACPVQAGDACVPRAVCMCVRSRACIQVEERLHVSVCDCECLSRQMCKHLGCGHWQTTSVTVCACHMFGILLKNTLSFGSMELPRCPSLYPSQPARLSWSLPPLGSQLLLEPSVRDGVDARGGALSLSPRQWPKHFLVSRSLPPPLPPLTAPQGRWGELVTLAMVALPAPKATHHGGQGGTERVPNLK